MAATDGQPGRSRQHGHQLIEQCPLTERSQEEDLAARRCSKPFGGSSGRCRASCATRCSLRVGRASYSQIGFILGVPVGTVKWRVSEARRVLKEKMAAVGHPYDG